MTIDDVEAAFPAAIDLHLVDDPVRAAVLAGVIDRGGGPALLLIRRALELDRDPGLMALPGGFIEAGEDPVTAALREAHEEIGLDPSLVRLRDGLGTFERPRTGIPVASYLGVVHPEATFVASVEEVHEIFEIPLARLLAPHVSWQEEWTFDGASRTMSFFADEELLGQNLIWGLTAAIIARLLAGVAPALARRLQGEVNGA